MPDKNETAQKSISVILQSLRSRLTEAAELSSQAFEAIEQGEQNQAIGTIIGFEQTLPEIKALYDTIMILHRNSNKF